MTEPPASPLERLFALVRRELRADDVELIEPGQPTPEADNVVSAPLPGGRQVAASFVSPPDDRDALERRLAVIAGTFTQSLEDSNGDGHRARPLNVAHSLHEELRALATRARAADAVVIDAHSPVVWGSAADKNPYGDIVHTPELEEALRYLAMSRHELVQSIPPSGAEPTGAAQDVTAAGDSAPPPPGPDPETRRELTRSALRAIRLLPELESLRKGKPFRDVVRGPELGYVVHSFAAIYLAVLVFEGPFDELRAQRAITDALPRVERLVLALPPFDPEPEPMADVISIRRSRRR